LARHGTVSDSKHTAGSLSPRDPYFGPSSGSRLTLRCAPG
jgi:hypothetical protein